MTSIVETEVGVPLLITSKTELSARSGGLLRAAASGALVRIDDLNIPCAAALLVPPSLIPRVLQALGIDPAEAPEPGTARDHLV